MNRFQMLLTEPIGDPHGVTHYFIDGQPASQAEYEKLARHARRHEDFKSYRFANRWHYRSVVYV